jgi:hypothetical protein
VLEHIADIEPFEGEIHRVLKSSGCAIHVIPTHTWRLWTSLSHGVDLAKLGGLEAARRVRDLTMSRPTRERSDGASKRGPSAAPPGRRRTLGRVVRTLAGWEPHGERGNTLTEFSFYFRPDWWERHFRTTGWTVRQSFPVGVFYTGHVLAGAWFTIAQRERWARVLGSSTHCFVLEH